MKLVKGSLRVEGDGKTKALVYGGALAMVLALAVYYAVYLALTPPECLQPNQLGKLWDNFGYLFTPYYERWLP